jgi:hypothetical protein
MASPRRVIAVTELLRRTLKICIVAGSEYDARDVVQQSSGDLGSLRPAEADIPRPDEHC